MCGMGCTCSSCPALAWVQTTCTKGVRISDWQELSRGGWGQARAPEILRTDRFPRRESGREEN